MRRQEWIDAVVASIRAAEAPLEVFDYPGEGHLHRRVALRRVRPGGRGAALGSASSRSAPGSANERGRAAPRRRGLRPAAPAAARLPTDALCWDAVAERLAGEFMVVCPDLRGYGESPKSGSDFSKRAMAADVLALMHQLGYERFAVAGHDRGALVGQRLALEHPEAVSHLAVLDNVPVLDMWESTGRTPRSGPTTCSSSPSRRTCPSASSRARRRRSSTRSSTAGPPSGVRSPTRPAPPTTARSRVRRTSARCARTTGPGRPSTSSTTAPTGRPGRRIAAPLLVLWQEPGGAAPPFDPLAIWRGWADDVTGRGLDCGHFLPEERPDEVAAALRELLARPAADA